MTTYAVMRSRIEDEIYDATITSSVNSAILDAISFYGRKKFWFNQTTLTWPTVAAQELYGTSDNASIPNVLEFLEPLKVTSGSYKYDVDPVPHEKINSAQNGAITGLPCHYSYFNLNVRLYPIPDAVYTITAYVHYKLTALSADGDSNAWTTDAEELIRTRAKRQLALHKLWDAEMYTRLKPAEDEALAALRSETKLRLPTKRLSTDYPTRGGSYNIYTD
jgi:hypothetical protein